MTLLTVRHAQFVLRSELFEDCDAAWDGFAESEPDFCWGTNTRSLVTPADVQRVLNDVANRDLTDADCDSEKVHSQVETVKHRLDTLGTGVLIDLEN